MRMDCTNIGEFCTSKVIGRLEELIQPCPPEGDKFFEAEFLLDTTVQRLLMPEEKMRPRVDGGISLIRDAKLFPYGPQWLWRLNGSLEGAVAISYFQALRVEIRRLSE